MFREHPITAGIEAFTVHGELYVEAYDASVEVHMVALDRGLVHPMVWSRAEGHIAPGHGSEVWRLGPYKQLILQPSGG